ncbi:MAG: NACHT domain-containing protein, partial [Chloroflexota bacterium]
MSAKETFSLIVQKVKETFDFLRESFAETPLEPDRQSKNFSVPEVDSLVAKQPPSAEPVLQKVQPEKGFITKPLSSIKRIANKTPASTSIQFSDIHLTYLQSLVDACSFVIFPGLGEEGRLLRVPLELAYVPITLMDKRIGIIRPERDDGPYGAASALSLSSALQRYRRLLVQGGPGSGKTTLSQILLLSYATSLINVHAPKISSSSSPETKVASHIGKSRLLTVEKGYLPVFVSLQELGHYLLKKVEKLEEEDWGCLRAYLHEIPAGSNCAIYPLPEAFFDEYLSTGEAIVIFDGLDELADPKLRKRVIHLIRKFIQQYPTCRYVVSSRLFELDERFLSSEQFGTLELGEFTPLQMRKYLSTIKSFVESGLPGDGTSDVQLQARQSTDKLIDLIDANPLLADLATSPLLLNMLMLVKRDRDQMPLTRADLFESGVQILFEHRLAKSLAGKKPEERKLDQVEARQALEMVAFWLHQNNETRFNPQQLMPILERWFLPRRSGDEVQASASAQTLLSFLLLSSGLLVPERSEFVFSQRTFQEFLAAHALADREDTLAFTLNFLSSTWWRNVIFFESS